MRILVTGAAGLIGYHLTLALKKQGHDVVRFDKKNSTAQKIQQDVTHYNAVSRAIRNCDGVVHLAAVSRVVWAESSPKSCRLTNIGGTRNVIEAALKSRARPWLIFASSREVYGQPSVLPAIEDTILDPINIYGRSKFAGEKLVLRARDEGLRTSICRLSNVYGWIEDHHDRVVPSFSYAAAAGGVLRIDGGEREFDFTHISDVIDGLMRLISLVSHGDNVPSVHFVSGRGTTLSELAQIATRHASGNNSVIRQGIPRVYDVEKFIGDPQRARQLLGWFTKISIEQGISELVRAHEQKIEDEPLSVRRTDYLG